MTTKTFNFNEFEIQVQGYNIIVLMRSTGGCTLYRWRLEKSELHDRKGVAFEKDPTADSLLRAKIV